VSADEGVSITKFFKAFGTPTASVSDAQYFIGSSETSGKLPISEDLNIAEEGLYNNGGEL